MAKNTEKSPTRFRVDLLLSRILVNIMLALLRFYRYFLSPWIGNQCRFYPTCSEYSAAAYKEHGFIKGSALTMIRIVKCNPWHQGGLDEVPKAVPKDATCCSANKHHSHN